MSDDAARPTEDAHPFPSDAAIHHYGDRLGDVDMVPLVAMRKLLTVSHLVMLDLERVAQRLGHSFADLHLLGTLGVDRGRAISATDLASILYVSTAALSSRIKRLEKDGLLERRRNAADHRSIDLFLTAKGEGLVDECIRGLASTARIAQLFGEMEPGNLRQFAAVLRDIHRVLKRDFVGAAPR